MVFSKLKQKGYYSRNFFLEQDTISPGMALLFFLTYHCRIPIIRLNNLRPRSIRPFQPDSSYTAIREGVGP